MSFLCGKPSNLCAVSHGVRCARFMPFMIVFGGSNFDCCAVNLAIYYRESWPLVVRTIESCFVLRKTMPLLQKESHSFCYKQCHFIAVRGRIPYVFLYETFVVFLWTEAILISLDGIIF